MANLSFQPVTLDSRETDADAMMVFRGEKLVAVLTRLDELHGPLRGRWFVEAMFMDNLSAPDDTFAQLAHFEQWIRY